MTCWLKPGSTDDFPHCKICFCTIEVSQLASPYVFAFATVTADASHAAVEHLDGAEHQLQQPHGQQNGEQDDIPHHYVFWLFAFCPHSLVSEVAAFTDARESRESRTNLIINKVYLSIYSSHMCEVGHKERVWWLSWRKKWVINAGNGTSELWRWKWGKLCKLFSLPNILLYLYTFSPSLHVQLLV